MSCFPPQPLLPPLPSALRRKRRPESYRKSPSRGGVKLGAGSQASEPSHNPPSLPHQLTTASSAALQGPQLSSALSQPASHRKEVGPMHGGERRKQLTRAAPCGSSDPPASYFEVKHEACSGLSLSPEFPLWPLQPSFHHESLDGKQLSPLWAPVRTASPSRILCTQGWTCPEGRSTAPADARRGDLPDSCPTRGYFHRTGTSSPAPTPWESPRQGIVRCPVSTPQLRH